MNKPELKQIVRNLRKSTPEAVLYDGLGHCVYLAKLVHDQFTAAKVPSQILIGRKFKSTPDGNAAELHAHHTIEHLEGTTDDRFKPIYDNYIKRGGTLINIGHAVVLVDDTIYDPTADQFGLPTTYPLDQFLRTWKTIKIGTVEILPDDCDEFFARVSSEREYPKSKIQSILEKILCLN